MIATPSNLYQLIAQVNGGAASRPPPPPPPVTGSRPSQPAANVNSTHCTRALHVIASSSNNSICTGLAVAPTVVQNDDADGASILRNVKRGAYDSIVISPGPGAPHRAADVGEWHLRTVDDDPIFAIFCEVCYRRCLRKASTPNMLLCELNLSPFACAGLCPALLDTATDVPVLGVCLGMQLLAAVHGGRVAHAPEPVHGRLSSIEHNGHALFSSIPSGVAGVPQSATFSQTNPH